MDGQAISIGSGEHGFAGEQAPGEPAALWAVIPVKNLASAKQRLKDCLGPRREDFTLAMLEDVLAAVADSKAVAGTVVVTSDPKVADLAAEQGFVVAGEQGYDGLNAAIERGVSAVRRLGGGRIVVLPSDIPLLTGAELDRVIDTFDRQMGNTDDGAVGISPSSDAGGTNCLILGVRKAFTFQYGPDSYSIHCDFARAEHRNVLTVPSQAISLDIDEPLQVKQLLEFCQQHPEFQKTRTWKFLQTTKGIDRKMEGT